MISPDQFLNRLLVNGINFYAGVPDSLLQGFITAVQTSISDHFITASEGAAVSLAAGYYLSTSKPGLVYMQNSGLGNCINPLTSLVDKSVYGIPMILMIGWRGQPGKKDEPQHYKMGEVTLKILKCLKIPYFIFSQKSNWQMNLDDAILKMVKTQSAVAIVIEEGFFTSKPLNSLNSYSLSLEMVFKQLIPKINNDYVVLCSTGKIGRIFYLENGKVNNSINKYLLNVGAMGHTSAIAIALNKYCGHNVILFDGDGSLLMHMGTLVTNSRYVDGKFFYILLNNGVHLSVGGQPTGGFNIDFGMIANGCGINNASLVTTEEELSQINFNVDDTTRFIEIRINTTIPESLPRPKESFITLKENLMRALKSLNGTGGL